MGPNDWDVGTLVRLGSCPNHEPKWFGQWCVGAFFIGALAHILKNIERRQSAKDRNCRKGRGGDRRVPIYIYIYIHTHTYICMCKNPPPETAAWPSGV